MTKWGSSGTGNGQFNLPSGIAVDASNNIYVADQLNNRIQKFNSSGQYITQWGSFGSGNLNFNYPLALAFDSDNNVVVADYGNFCLKNSLQVAPF
ncbi:MAG: hypothetical protein HWD62_05295 [Cyclobacteriaceae bacterium]|nr:MAG: hypothetical protein HWD62_05295 [Cyclobacteriaceae bacterium]